MVQPSWIEPELATLTKERFSDPAWISERKLDGERCLAFASGDSVRLLTRNKKSITGTYPELAAALGAQRAGDFIVDGEIVAFDGPQTSFAQLQQRMQLAAPLPELVRRVPVYFYVFDVVYAEDQDLRRLPLLERKQVLRLLLSFGGPLRFSTHRTGKGEAHWQDACKKGWEGVIAKRADSPYRSGRTRDWLKFKCENAQEFVIGGYTDPQGGRAGFGALLIGYYDEAGSCTRARWGPVSTSGCSARCTRRCAGSSAARRRSAGVRCHDPGCTGPSLAWSARSASPNGPRRASSAIRGSWACGTTRTRPTWSGRVPDQMATPPGRNAIEPVPSSTRW